MPKSKSSNVLLITTDQQRFDTIFATGNRHIRTPHLDWLCDSGVVFTRAYTDSPVCVPARHTIMTGRHSYNQEVDFNCWHPAPIDPRTTLAGMLTAAGYQTRAQGKMHFVPERNHLGFEHMELLADYYRSMDRHPEYGRPMDHGMGQNETEPCISTVDESHSLTRWVVDRSVDFLETRDESRPFFLWTGFSKPHPPFDPCLPYWQMYADADVPDAVSGEWSRSADAIPPGFMLPTWELNGTDRLPPERVRDMRRAYYALITQVDYNLGVLFARLRELDLLDSTTIIFTSDHGEMLGDHHLGAKSVYFEGSAHVPLIIKPAAGLLPGSFRGARCAELVCLADIMPTVVASCGLNAAAAQPVDGLDMFAVLRGERSRTALIGETLHLHCVIEGDFKYHYTSAGGAELLFDISTDPYETRDLIPAGTHRKVHERLRTTLLDRLVKYRHPAVRNGEFAPTPAPVASESRGRWPGFHSSRMPSDVLH